MFCACQSTTTDFSSSRFCVSPDQRPTVFRFWPGEPDRQGVVIPRGRSWVFSYAPGESDDEALFHVENHAISVGEYLTITEPDGEKLPFRVVSCHD
jgi:hypothetical protein